MITVFFLLGDLNSFKRTHLPRAAGVRILGVTGAGRAVPGRGADRPAGCSGAGVRGGARIAAARTGPC